MTSRGSLFRKYVIVFSGLVIGVLLASGGLEIYFSYLENREALVALHARYAPLILNLAGRALGRLAAEEIVQDVFLAVW